MNLLTARLLALTDNSFLATMIETTPGDIELVTASSAATSNRAAVVLGPPVEEVLARSPLVDEGREGAQKADQNSNLTPGWAAAA